MTDPGAAPPLLSICIPTHGRADLLLTLLAEIDRPDFLPFPFDVLIADNASPPEQSARIAAVAPRHFRCEVVRLPENIGMFPNLWGSLRRARGELAVYLADDDRLVPERLAAVVEIARSAPEAGAIFASWEGHAGTEDRILFPATPLEDASFDAGSVEALVARLTALGFVPEIALYRTEILGRTMFPAHTILWPYLLIDRMLRTASVRTTAQVFYRTIQWHPGETTERTGGGRQLDFAHWEAVVRGWSLLAARAAGTGPGPMRPRDARAAAASAHFRTQALLSAAHQGRYVEAYEIGHLLAVETGAPLPLSAADAQALGARAALQAVGEALAALPELPGLCVYGLDAAAAAEVAAAIPGLPVVSAGPLLPGPTLAGHAVLTHSEASRRALIARGFRPGLVFSWESLQQLFALPGS